MDEKQYNLLVGARIRAARQNKRLTLKELGNLVGISESTTQRYEKGQIKSIDINIAKKFAKALEISAETLLGWDETEHAPAAAAPVAPRCPLACTPREKDLVQKYRVLSPDGKATVDAVVDVQYKASSPHLKEEGEIS